MKNGAHITGAARGIGRAAAEMLMLEGARVVASDLVPDDAMASSDLLPFM